MLVQEYGFEWVKENIKHCPISNSMDLLGKKFAERWKHKGGEDTATASIDTTATEQ
jgi:hypothetical protein